MISDEEEEDDDWSTKCENILYILLYSLFYKYNVNMSYFDWNELIFFCVIVIKNFFKAQSTFKKSTFPKAGCFWLMLYTES